MENRGCIIYSCMNPKSDIQTIQSICNASREKNYDAICIPQWFVSYASDTLKGSDVKIATVIGLPGGTTSTYAKYAETKQAIVNGASIVLIPVNMKLCASENYNACKNDLTEAMVPAKGKAAVMAVVETAGIKPSQLQKIAKVCMDCDVDSVLLSDVTGGRADLETINSLKEKGLKVGLFFSKPDSSDLDSYKNAGISCFVVPKSV